MDVSSEYQQLRDLLVAPEATALDALERDLEHLRDQIHDPAKLALILRSALTQALTHCDPELRIAITNAVTPLLDQALREKSAQDAAGMASALAPASTGAIALHYASSPQEAARDLAPLVSASIKEQIRGERDSMIDALYPIIGSTIARYFSQALATLVRTINDKIESRLSMKGLVRKVHARILGISEAELLLREGMPWSVEAAFLIHKQSGLVIAKAHSPGAPQLDPDLLSGMLTAIRNLFNESLLKNHETHELDQIAFGESKIVIEAAGYCYLAAVVRGEPDEAFSKRLHETMASIVQLPGDCVRDFEGDPAGIPPAVPRAIADLVNQPPASPQAGKRRPYVFLLVLCLLLAVIAAPLLVGLYRDSADRALAGNVEAALAASSPAPLKHVMVDLHRGVVRLSGTAANELQRTRAAAIVAAVVPALRIENHIAPEDPPPLQVLVASRVQETVSTLNTAGGVFINARYRDGALSVIGAAPDSSTVAKIAYVFDELPGIRTIQYNVDVGVPRIDARLHFAPNSAVLRSAETAKLDAVQEVLERLPMFTLDIIGHSDQTGSEPANRRMSLARANAVRMALMELGVPGGIMQVRGIPDPPPGQDGAGSDSLSRCVRFTLTPANPRSMP